MYSPIKGSSKLLTKSILSLSLCLLIDIQIFFPFNCFIIHPNQDVSMGSHTLKSPQKPNNHLLKVRNTLFNVKLAKSLDLKCPHFSVILNDPRGWIPS